MHPTLDTASRTTAGQGDRALGFPLAAASPSLACMKDDAPPPSDAPDLDAAPDLAPGGNAPDGQGGPAPGDRDYALTRLTRERHGKAGWQVALIRRGRLVQASFYDRVYGSRAASLHVARAYRDAVIEVLPPLSRRDMRRIVRRNRSPGSSVTGVSFQAATDKRAACWVARIELPGEPGRRRRERAPNPPADGTASGGAAGEGEAKEGTAPAPDPTRAERKRPARRKRIRYFSVDRLGYEEARRCAEAERERMLAVLEDGDLPALRSARATELHEALRGGGCRSDGEGDGEAG